MKKFLHSLLALFVGVTTVAFAQEEAETVQAWDGSNHKIEMFVGDKLTFEYTATEDGTFYIYADNQDVNDNVPLDIKGGWYHDGGIAEEDSLQDAGNYDNGTGVYGWIRVFENDVIRFTVTALETGEGQLTEFTLKSLFFKSGYGGDSWENPIVLTLNKEVAIPTYPNNSPEVLLGINDRNNVTFCEFTADFSGVASIYTNEYLVYVLEENNLGNPETPFKAVSQDVKNNNHEFVVTSGTDYLVVIPNTRPTKITLKKTADRVGLSPKFPVEITSFPAELDLVKGNNYYAFSHELIGDNKMLEIAVAAGWNGTITYMEDPTEESKELAADAVNGTAKTFVKNVDPRYLDGNKVIINFNMTDKSNFASAATLKLRAPKAGESFSTAKAAVLGTNTIDGAAGDYWYAYTAEFDGEYSIKAEEGNTIKHVNYTAASEVKNGDNVYRVNAGQTIYVCITTAQENTTFSISGKEIVAGDYRDKPIYFELDETISFQCQGIVRYYSFEAKEDGFAIFQSVGWSLHFYLDGQESGQLNPQLDREEMDGDYAYIYKLAITAGQRYVVAVECAIDKNDKEQSQFIGKDITITTAFGEPAAAGDICSNAIEIKDIDKTINLDYAFDKIKWHKYTAGKDGFYIVKAKLGYAANMTTKVGDCDAAETNAGSDNSVKDAYMAGYKMAKVYLEKGQTLYIYTKTGHSNDENLYGANFYLTISFAEARPGEALAVAIEAEPYTDYTVMKNDEEGYEQWYVYTIPAGKEVSISMTASVKYISKCLNFCPIEDAYKYLKTNTDYVQSNITNEEGTIIGKKFDFVTIDTDRTFYIKVSTINAMYYPVTWKIEGEELSTNIVVEEVADEAPVIYDLMGRRVMNPTKGIYIINGVKRVIK